MEQFQRGVLNPGRLWRRGCTPNAMLLPALLVMCGKVKLQVEFAQYILVKDLAQICMVVACCDTLMSTYHCCGCRQIWCWFVKWFGPMRLGNAL